MAANQESIVPQSQELPLNVVSLPVSVGTTTTDLTLSSEVVAPTVIQAKMYKNKLQEYTQKSHLPLPLYRTVNEGCSQASIFRSTVQVNGIFYTSPNRFLRVRDAEQDVARLAMDCISTNLPNQINNESVSHVLQLRQFCKSILNEFATKMKMAMPLYNTTECKGVHPCFTSTVLFDGMNFMGKPCLSKKEAEQVVARSAVVSLFGHVDVHYRQMISEILNSKVRLYSSFDLQDSPAAAEPDADADADADDDAVACRKHLSTFSLPTAVDVKTGSAVQDGELLPVVSDSSKRKMKKKIKKTNKKHRSDITT